MAVLEERLRRPSAFLCCAYTFGCVIEHFFSFNNTILMIIIVGTIITTIKFSYANNIIKELEKLSGHCGTKQQWCLFFCAIILVMLGALQYSYSANRVTTVSNHITSCVEIEGVVTSVIQKNIKCHNIVVMIQKIDGEYLKNSHEKILVNIYEEYQDYYSLNGKNVVISGTLDEPAGRRNPKTFDYKQYLKTKGIYATMKVDKEHISEGNVEKPLLQFVARTKFIFKQNVNNCFDDEVSGIIMGMTFGDKNNIDEDEYDMFQKNGICHILAVSGLHIGALYLSINALTRGKRNIAINIIIIMLLSFYAVLADLSPSVIRAVLMIALHIISKYLYCRYDLFTSGALTMTVMTIINPLIILNLGFQLSFVAIFTLSVILPTLTRVINLKFATIIAIQLGMSPISALCFNYFSWSAFIANIPILFLAGILIPLELLLLSISIFNQLLDVNQITYLSYLFSVLFQLVSILVEFFVKVLMFINNLCFVEKVSFNYTVSPPLSVILMYYTTLFLVCSEHIRILWQRRYYKKIIKILALGLCLCFILGNMSKDGFENTEFVFVDVGQGDCLLIRTDDGKNVLIDCGGSASFDVGKKILMPYLLKNGVRTIDLALITHLHQDHVGGLNTIAKELKVKQIGIYEANCVAIDNVVKKTGAETESIIYLTAGQKIQIGEELQIEILYPEKKEIVEYNRLQSNSKDENESCLVIKATLKDISVIMTGDIDKNGEKSLIDLQYDACKANILKIAHHGSKYSTSECFLDVIQPDIAVIQTGKNMYGHPHKETLDRLKEKNVIVYRNDLHGAVGIDIKKDGKVKIRTMI